MWSFPRFNFESFAFYHICVSNKLQFINISQMTQTYFVQTETFRIYFKKPKMNFNKFSEWFRAKDKRQKFFTGYT